MRALMLVLALAAPALLPADEAVAPASLEAVSGTAKPLLWSASLDPISYGIGASAMGTGVSIEHAYWNHFSLLGMGDYNFSSVAGRGANLWSNLDLHLGSRWRPFDERSLAGPFLGLGLQKGIYFDLESQGYSGGTAFSLSQYLSLYTELGWQWVSAGGLLRGLKVTVPIYADWARGYDILREWTTFSVILGVAW